MRTEKKMFQVSVGNLDPRVTNIDLWNELSVYDSLRSVWVDRRPHGCAFIKFDDSRDAHNAVREFNGKNGWRVELSDTSNRGVRGRSVRGRGRGRGNDLKCIKCGEPGHFARNCPMHLGSKGHGSGRYRSPSPRRPENPRYGRRSYSPSGRRSPRRRSVSPSHGHSNSRSLLSRHGYRDSPYAKSKSPARGHIRSTVFDRLGPANTTGKSQGHGYSRSPRRGRHEPTNTIGSYSPSGRRSPRRRNVSPSHAHSNSRSLLSRHGYRDSPYTKSKSPARGHIRSTLHDRLEPANTTSKSPARGHIRSTVFDRLGPANTTGKGHGYSRSPRRGRHEPTNTIGDSKVTLRSIVVKGNSNLLL